MVRTLGKVVNVTLGDSSCVELQTLREPADGESLTEVVTYPFAVGIIRLLWSSICILTEMSNRNASGALSPCGHHLLEADDSKVEVLVHGNLINANLIRGKHCGVGGVSLIDHAWGVFAGSFSFLHTFLVFAHIIQFLVSTPRK